MGTIHIGIFVLKVFYLVYIFKLCNLGAKRGDQYIQGFYCLSKIMVHDLERN